MAYLYRTRSKKTGKPHPKWRYEYTDHTGRRRKGTGNLSKDDTSKLAASIETREDEIRRGLRQAPKESDKPREFQATVNAYLAWGNSQGGRGGRPWAVKHAKNRAADLAWWQERLGLSLLSDLVDVLPRMEHALRELTVTKHTKQGTIEAPASGKYKNNVADALCAFCDWSVSRGYLATDPLQSFAPYDGTPKTLRRTVTADVIGKLLKACLPANRLLYTVAINSGLRVNELAHLKVKHVAIPQGGLWLEAEWTKSRKPGFQYLPFWLMEEIANSVNSDPETMIFHGLSHAVRKLDADLKRAGIPKHLPGKGKLDFHSLRGAFSSLIDQAGASIGENQNLTRHASPRTTFDRYVKADSGRMRQLVEFVGNSIKSLIANATEPQRKVAGLESLSPNSFYDKVVVGSIPTAATISAPPNHGQLEDREGAISAQVVHLPEYTQKQKVIEEIIHSAIEYIVKCRPTSRRDWFSAKRAAPAPVVI